MDEQEQTYFLTVVRDVDARGVFCRKNGASFRKNDKPHTEVEMQDILGLFWIILAPESRPLAFEELSKFTYWRPLAEYSGEFGIALMPDDVPIRSHREPEA